MSDIVDDIFKRALQPAGDIIITAPQRDDADIMAGMRDRLMGIAQYCQVAFLGSSDRLFVAVIKDAKLNQWRLIGELAELSYAFVKYAPIYPREHHTMLIERQVIDVVEEVTERLTRAMHEFGCAVTCRNGDLYLAVPMNTKEGIPQNKWREIGCLARNGIVPAVAPIVVRPS